MSETPKAGALALLTLLLTACYLDTLAPEDPEYDAYCQVGVPKEFAQPPSVFAEYLRDTYPERVKACRPLVAVVLP